MKMKQTNFILTFFLWYSNDKEERQSKIWYHQDRYREVPEKVVELGMDNNASYNRIYTTPELSLIIKGFAATDAGIYLCHGEEGQETENKFNYRIERNTLYRIYSSIVKYKRD